MYLLGGFSVTANPYSCCENRILIHVHEHNVINKLPLNSDLKVLDSHSDLKMLYILK